MEKPKELTKEKPAAVKDAPKPEETPKLTKKDPAPAEVKETVVGDVKAKGEEHAPINKA